MRPTFNDTVPSGCPSGQHFTHLRLRTQTNQKRINAPEVNVKLMSFCTTNGYILTHLFRAGCRRWCCSVVICPLHRPTATRTALAFSLRWKECQADTHAISMFSISPVHHTCAPSVCDFNLLADRAGLFAFYFFFFFAKKWIKCLVAMAHETMLRTFCRNSSVSIDDFHANIWTEIPWSTWPAFDICQRIIWFISVTTLFDIDGVIRIDFVVEFAFYFFHTSQSFFLLS